MPPESVFACPSESRLSATRSPCSSTQASGLRISSSPTSLSASFLSDKNSLWIAHVSAARHQGALPLSGHPVSTFIASFYLSWQYRRVYRHVPGQRHLFKARRHACHFPRTRPSVCTLFSWRAFHSASGRSASTTGSTLRSHWCAGAGLHAVCFADVSSLSTMSP